MSNENPKPDGGEPQGPWGNDDAEQAFFKRGENMGQAPADQADIDDGWADVLQPAPVAPATTAPKTSVLAPSSSAQVVSDVEEDGMAVLTRSRSATAAPAATQEDKGGVAAGWKVDLSAMLADDGFDPSPAVAAPAEIGNVPVRRKGGVSGGAAGVSEDGQTAELRVPRDDERPRGVFSINPRTGGVAGKMSIGGSTPAGVGSTSGLAPANDDDGNWSFSSVLDSSRPQPAQSASAVSQRPASADYGPGPAVDESADDEQPVQGTRRKTKALVAAAIGLVVAGVGYKYLMKQRPAPDGSFETNCSLFADDAQGNVDVACEGTQRSWEFSPEQVRGKIRADVKLAKDGVLNLLCKPEFQRPTSEQLKSAAVSETKILATVRGMCRPVGGKR